MRWLAIFDDTPGCWPCARRAGRNIWTTCARMRMRRSDICQLRQMGGKASNEP